MTHELPELPDWVKTLLDLAREEGYKNGIRDGRRYQFEDSKSAIERTDPR